MTFSLLRALQSGSTSKAMMMMVMEPVQRFPVGRMAVTSSRRFASCSSTTSTSQADRFSDFFSTRPSSLREGMDTYKTSADITLAPQNNARSLPSLFAKRKGGARKLKPPDTLEWVYAVHANSGIVWSAT